MANVITIHIDADNNTNGAFDAINRSLNGLQSNVADAGKNMQGSMSEGVMGGLKSSLSLGALMPVITGALGALAIVLAPLIATMIGGAIILGLGAGLVGMGAMLLLQNDDIKKEFTATFAEIKEIMTDAFMPLLPVIRTAVGVIKGLAETFAPVIKQAMQLAKVPLQNFVKQLGAAFEALAPVIGPVMQAFTDILDQIGPQLPGIFEKMAGSLIELAGVMSENAGLFADTLVFFIEMVPLVISLIAKIADLADIYSAFGDALQSGSDSGFMDNLRTAAETVLPAIQEAFTQIKEAVLPVLTEIWGKIKDELIPAFGELIAAVAPVAQFFIEILGPYVAETMGNIMRVISGAIDIITGIIQVFVGVLTGDWQKAWDGVKKITQGIRGILTAIVRQAINGLRTAWNAVVGIFGGIMSRAVDAAVRAARALGRGISGAIRSGLSAIGGALSAVRNRITGFFAGAGRWLYNAGRNIVNGIINGIRSAAGAIMGAVRSVIPDSVERFIPGFATGGIVGGAAGGGARGGMVMVGEQGRELVRLPFGSQVIPNGQTEAMVGGSGGGGGQPIVIQLMLGATALGEVLIDPIRHAVRTRGGNVQAVLGR